jgi:imidazolonepropionase-like amidohydrolase
MTSFYVADVTLFDGHRVQQRRGVLVEGERIAWVGAHVRAPRDAASVRAVDGRGRTLTPGLIDVHVHLAMDGSADFAEEGRALNEARAVAKATQNLLRHLSAGVTTVRDLGGPGIAELSRCVEEGVVPGSNLVSAGRALTVTGGHGHNVGFAREVDGPDGMRVAVREEVRAGAHAIKLVATGGVLTPRIGATFTAFTPEELAAAVGEAHKWGCGVAAHAIGAEGILQAVLAGVDSVEHCVQATPQIVREMKSRGTFRSATIVALLGIAAHPEHVPAYALDKASALVSDAEQGHVRCVRAGIRQVVGTDAGTPFNPHGGAPREILAMIGWGTHPIDALIAATSNGAELLRTHDVGTVRAGMRADLCLYDANPVEDPSTLVSPRRVWKDGTAWRG